MAAIHARDMPVHPMLVHLPIAFAIFGPVFFLALLLVIRRRPEARGLWKWTILWQVLLAASIYAAMATGDQDQSQVANHTGPDVVLAHENAAELLLFVSLIALLPALAGVKVSRLEFPARITAFIMQLVILALCVQTARLGGELVYKHGGAKAHGKNKELGCPPSAESKRCREP